MGKLQHQSSSPADTEPRKKPQPLFPFWRCFWLSFLVVSLWSAWYSYYVPSNNIAWADNFASASPQALRDEKPMLLFFTGKWCVPCRIMKRRVWADAEVMATVNGQFVPVMIDVDDSGAVDAMRRYRVGAPPHTTVVDSQGNLIQQQQGGMGKAEFLNWLASATPSLRKAP